MKCSLDFPFRRFSITWWSCSILATLITASCWIHLNRFYSIRSCEEVPKLLKGVGRHTPLKSNIASAKMIVGTRSFPFGGSAYFQRRAQMFHDPKPSNNNRQPPRPNVVSNKPWRWAKRRTRCLCCTTLVAPLVSLATIARSRLLALLRWPVSTFCGCSSIGIQDNGSETNLSRAAWSYEKMDVFWELSCTYFNYRIISRYVFFFHLGSWKLWMVGWHFKII